MNRSKFTLKLAEVFLVVNERNWYDRETQQLRIGDLLKRKRVAYNKKMVRVVLEMLNYSNPQDLHSWLRLRSLEEEAWEEYQKVKIERDLK